MKGVWFSCVFVDAGLGGQKRRFGVCLDLLGLSTETVWRVRIVRLVRPIGGPAFAPTKGWAWISSVRLLKPSDSSDSSDPFAQ